MLDLRMRSFLEVVETGSYTAAAKKLNLTQPAVTQHISRLEEHYGCQFFCPEGRGVRLTDAGLRFHDYACMQHCNEKQLIKDLQGLQPALRLGSTLSIADYYLPEKLAAMCISDGFSPHVIVGNTKYLLGKLLEGQLDAAFIEGIFDRSLFESRIFTTPRFMPVVSANHPLVGKRIHHEQLHAYPLIVREPGSGTRAIMENYLAYCNDSPLSFSKIWEIGSFALIKNLLRQTNAVSFMYEAVAKREVERGELAFLSIDGYDLRHDMHFVYLRHTLRSRELNRFFDEMISFSASCG